MLENLEKVRLLLVDDEENFRTTLAKRLNKRVAAVWQAGDGKACLDLLAGNPVDVIVMDVRMPGMDGIETLKAVQSKYAQTETILLTGQANAGDGVKGIKAGAYDYLGKPVEFDHLLAKIGQAFRKKLQEESKRKADELKAKMNQQLIATERLAALGTLAAGIAHEINNPLAIINQAAGLMSLLMQKEELADMPHKESFIKALSKIEVGVSRAGTITHQLLNTVRKADAIICEVDLNELIKEAVLLVNREASHKNIEIILDIEPPARNIWTDPNQVRQVLINLLTNAIQASGNQDKVTVQARRNSKYILLTVVDTGTGIPKQDIDRIFEPFFSTKSPKEGTGLGLYVTKEIIAKLGGTITVDSRVGFGTRFEVSLPDRQGNAIGPECEFDNTMHANSHLQQRGENQDD